MKRRRFLFGLTAASAILWAGATMAATYADGVVGQLTKQGYYNIAMETTWLGRVRIIADRADGKREIILNPRTGEILRDSWQASGAGNVTPIIDEVNGGGPGSSGDDAKGGGGSSNSGGSGSGGSGSGGSGSDDSGGDDHSGSDDGGGHGGNNGGSDDDDGGGDNGGSSGHGGSDSSHGGGEDGGNDDNGGKGN